MSRTAGLAVAALLVLVVAGGLAWYLATPSFLGDRRTGQYAPLFADIEPADEAIVRGTEAWVRWESSMGAKGRVLWRKAGESKFETVDAGEGIRLLARLRPLQPDGKYEYIVEQSADAMTLRSSLRTFAVQAGLAFDPPTVEQTVERDYDQTVTLTLRNDGKEKITVAAKALAQFEDLPADIVGPGSVDEPAEIQPGQKLNLRFAVAAADAARQIYDIPIESAGASALVRVRVSQPKLNLSFRVVGENPHTLAKTIEVRNVGDTLADLAIRVVPPNEVEVRLEPQANHARLGKRESVRFIARPLLHLEFQSLKAELEAAAAGQSVRFPVEFNAPPGQRLIGVRTGSHKESSCNDWYCTNRPTTCSTCQGPEGNGPAMPPGGASKVADSAERIVPRRTASIVPISFRRELTTAQLPGVRGQEPSYVTALREWSGLLEAAKCGTPGTCSEAEIAHCLIEGRRLQRLYRRNLNFAKENRNIIEKLRRRRNEIVTRLAQGRPADLASHDANIQWHLDNLQAYLSRLDAIRGQYQQLQERCAGCVLLPDIGGEQIPPLSKTSACMEVLKRLSPEELEKRGFPKNSADLPDDQLAVKCVIKDSDPAPSADDDCADCARAVVPGVPIPTIVAKAIAQEVPGCSALCTFAQDLRAWEASTRDKIVKDPPSTDYANVVQPEPKVLSVPRPTTDAGRLAWDSLAALNVEISYLEAWLRSYERYQGAHIARDRQAMIRQAKAMLTFADQALGAGYASARAQYELERRAGPPTQTSSDEVIAEYLDNRATADVPPSIRQSLKAAGISDRAIEEAGKQLRRLPPEQLPKAFSSLSRLTVQGRVDEYDPPDVLILAHLRQLSRNLLETAGDADQGRRIQGRSPVRRRPGLIEAAQKRAGFSRAHRGAFAMPTEGNLADSSDIAAGWHADDRVSFAWHQYENEVVVATFDAQGNVLTAPQIIGTGRWPRVAAEGKRTAVAWSGGDGFVVRLHDGNQWGPEMSLAGREAAVAFAPGGPLYAAASTGLWRLGDKGFENIKQARYSQPAVAVDGKGRPHVASERDGRILYDDAEVDEGQRPSLTITSDGTPHLAYLAKGALVVRSRRGDQWSAPEVIPAKNPSWPTLATDGTGVRLTYLGAADHGPDALWLVRLPDKQPILMPSLAGNVTDAWVLVNFGLKSLRSTYRPHDVLVTVNDVWVKMFENTVPDGRYLFRLNPYHLFTSSGRPAPNRIGIRSWHMNGGHYASNSNYQLIVRTAWSERYAFAATEDEVRRTADNPHPTHDQPDLVVLANELELPVAAPKPGRINLTITIANLGEGHSQAARMEMLTVDGRSLGSAQVPPLKSGELTTIKMPLDYDGKLDRVTFKVHQENRDLNPKNDTLTLTLWAAARDVAVKDAGSDEPTATDGTGEQPPVPKFDSGIKLDVGAWVPKRDGRHGWWGVTRRGEGPTKLAHWTKTANALVVPPGNYDLYWKQAFDPAPVLLKTDISIPAGQAPTVKVDTGIHLDVASWVPKRDRAHGWWGVTQQGDPPTKLVHWTKSGDALVVPPGTYDLYWKQAFDPAPVLLVSPLNVAAGELRTVAASSGVKLRVAAGTPALDRSHGWWGVVRAGEGADKLVHWSKGRVDQPLLVPPGRYDVFWKQNFAHTPERIKEDVTVEMNRLVEIDVFPPRAAAPTGPAPGAGTRR